MEIKPYSRSQLATKRFNCYLIYGPINSGKDQLSEKIQSYYCKSDTEVITYYNDDVLLNDESLVLECTTNSFFTKSKIVIIKGVNNKLFGVVEYLNKNLTDDCIVILVANELDKKSKLRSFFEKSTILAALPCYKVEDKDLRSIIKEQLSLHGLRVGYKEENLLNELLIGNSDNAKKEIEKLSIYMGNKNLINEDDIFNCVYNESKENFLDIAFFMGVNDIKFLNILSDNFSPQTDAISTLRATTSIIKRMIQIKYELTSKGFEEASKNLYPRIFFKQTELYKNKISKTDLFQLQNSLKILYDLELDVKQKTDITVSCIMSKILSVSYHR